MEVVGVLVPTGTTGEWVLKPRGSADIDARGLVWPRLDIEEAREQPLDTRLIVHGVALNGWGTFGDSTLHVRDATGAIRTVRTPQTPAATGDSVRVIGTIGTAPEIEAGPESTDVGLFAWDDIPWAEIAFPSVHWALTQSREVRDRSFIQPFGNPEGATGDKPPGL